MRQYRIGVPLFFLRQKLSKSVEKNHGVGTRFGSRGIFWILLSFAKLLDFSVDPLELLPSVAGCEQ